MHNKSRKDKKAVKECPKCGYNDLFLRYTNDDGMIAVKCKTCEYNWKVKPLNKL